MKVLIVDDEKIVRKGIVSILQQAFPDMQTIAEASNGEEAMKTVRGHKGWGSLFKAKYSLVVSFEAIEQNVPIYEPIRTAMEVEIENSEIELELSSNEE